ncbi:MAG: ABC transporter ATP-binding protein [Alphaproteobacteria bacterium]|nr:ABC transporter ATP-binding protein [Alphaproteobacteria bacterium]
MKTQHSQKHLSVQGLSVQLKRREVLREVSFDLDAGQFVGLIGPNGAGKSTLLKAVMGLLSRQGKIELKGAALEMLSPQERGRIISYLPQEREVNWPISVEELISLGRAPYHSPFSSNSQADLAAIEKAIAAMDLEHIRARSALELSGGERARALIARALAQETDLLLSDEPAAGLDPAHQIALMATFSKLARAGRTVLASLHELTLAGQWCDRLILLSEGCIIADGTPDEVLTKDNLANVYGVTAHVSRTGDGLAVFPTGLV